MMEEFIPVIRACLENGTRLLEDAGFLADAERPATAYVLAVIAQEELAKAFLLHLVAEGVIPWNPLILRAARDHRCKQLLCLVMDFLNPDIDEFLARMDAAVLSGKPFSFPSHVADAMNILRHERLGRWESNTWVWAEEPEYDAKALQIAEGRLDREKQDALYVQISRTGSVMSSPGSISPDKIQQALDRGRRLANLVERILEHDLQSIIDYKKVAAAFAALFASFARSAQISA